MPKVTFTQTRTPNDGSGRTFEAGKEYDLPSDSCERWIKRGAAQYSDGSAARGAPAPAQGRMSLNQINIEILSVIPDGWQDLPWIDLLALAKQFNNDVRSKEDAIAAVELEVERRAKKD